MTKSHISLQHSEGLVMQAAAQIYAAYITAGRVAEGDEESWMQKAIREAIRIAQATDDAIISDDEVDSSDGQAIGDIAVGRTRTIRSRHD